MGRLPATLILLRSTSIPFHWSGAFVVDDGDGDDDDYSRANRKWIIDSSGFDLDGVFCEITVLRQTISSFTCPSLFFCYHLYFHNNSTLFNW